MINDIDTLSFGSGPGEATKLAILLHGYGRNATTMQKMAAQIVAQIPGMGVLCPHAPEKLALPKHDMSGHALNVPQQLQPSHLSSYKENDMRQWFSIEGSRSELLAMLEHTSQAINNFIDRKRDIFALKDSDIILMGFSQGASLALYAATMRAAEIAALVVHSSPLFEFSSNDPRFKSAPPTLYIYGDSDEEFSQDIYRASVIKMMQYFGPNVTECKMHGLGHVTNAQSRKACADFIEGCLRH